MPKAHDVNSLWQLVDFTPGGCWVWTGYISDNGYGRVGMGGGLRYVHRLFYELSVGPIPEGAVIDHLCRTRNCVNHLHMDVVTRGENVLHGVGFAAKNAAKVACAGGHALSVLPDGSRRCVACKADTSRRWWAAHQEYKKKANASYRERNRDAINERQRARKALKRDRLLNGGDACSRTSTTD